MGLRPTHADEKKKGGHSGLPTVLPPNEFRRRVPSFSLPSRPVFSRGRALWAR